MSVKGLADAEHRDLVHSVLDHSVIELDRRDDFLSKPGGFVETPFEQGYEPVATAGKSRVARTPSHRELASIKLAEQTADCIRDTLGGSPYIDIRQIEVDVQGTRVILSGRLESFYHKQLVQQAINFAYPTVDLIDDLLVSF